MAERDLTAGMLTEIAAGTKRPRLFFEGEYDSSGSAAYLRLFTGVGTISWDGKTWTGGASLLEISPIREGTSLEPIGFSVTLNGMPADKRQLALSSMRKNKPGRLWLGFVDASNAVVDEPYPLRRGRFDMAPISRSGATMAIRISYEDRLVLLDRPGGPNGERRYTPEDQARRLAGDRGFDGVAELQDRMGSWGA